MARRGSCSTGIGKRGYGDMRAVWKFGPGASLRENFRRDRADDDGMRLLGGIAGIVRREPREHVAGGAIGQGIGGRDDFAIRDFRRLICEAAKNVAAIVRDEAERNRRESERACKPGSLAGVPAKRFNCRADGFFVAADDAFFLDLVVKSLSDDDRLCIDSQQGAEGARVQLSASGSAQRARDAANFFVALTAAGFRWQVHQLRIPGGTRRRGGWAARDW